MIKEYQSLSQTRWDCKYHVMLIPKRHKRKIFEECVDTWERFS